MSNITETVGKELNMTTLNRAIVASGINELLNNGDLFTFFAPSERLLENYRQAQLKNY